MPLEFPQQQLLLGIANVIFWLVIAIRVYWKKPAESLVESAAPTSGTHHRPACDLGAHLAVAGTGQPDDAVLRVSVQPFERQSRCRGPALLPPSLPLQILGFVVLTFGIVLMGWSYSVLRSFRFLAEIGPGHQLCTWGPYSKLRHPVYVGINLFYLGAFLVTPQLWFLVQVVANVLAYDYRARLEERALLKAFGAEYQRYMARASRLIPGFY